MCANIPPCSVREASVHTWHGWHHAALVVLSLRVGVCPPGCWHFVGCRLLHTGVSTAHAHATCAAAVLAWAASSVRKQVRTVEVRASVHLLTNGSPPEADQVQRDKRRLVHLARLGVEASIAFNYSYLNGDCLVPWV